jgi:hypothetical protein
MRIQVPLVIEMTDEQVKEYAGFAGLPHHGGPLRAKDVVDDVREHVLASVQALDDLCSVGADVSIKR